MRRPSCLFSFGLAAALLAACAGPPAPGDVAAIDSLPLDSVPFVEESLPPPLSVAALAAVTASTHEPVGYTRLTSRSCDAVVEDGWTVPVGSFAIAQDPDRGSVCQTTTRAGFGSARAPANLERAFAKPWPTTLYVRYWARTSANWRSHPILTKQFHFWINTTAGTGGGNRGFTALYGTGTAGFYVQGVLSTNGTMRPQAGAARGTWHLHEILLIGGAQGRVTYWLDGRQFLDQAVSWGSAGASGRWERISWSPTYGGNGPPAPVTMQEWWDDLYVSGAP